MLIVVPLYLVGGVPYSIGVFLLGMLGIKEYLDMKESEKRIANFYQIDFLFMYSSYYIESRGY